MKFKGMLLVISTIMFSQTFAMSISNTFEYIQVKVSTASNSLSGNFTETHNIYNYSGDYCTLKYEKVVKKKDSNYVKRTNYIFSITDMGEADSIDTDLYLSCENRVNCIRTIESDGETSKANIISIYGFLTDRIAEKTANAFKHLRLKCLENDPF